jgi:hypothetical protein
LSKSRIINVSEFDDVAEILKEISILLFPYRNRIFQCGGISRKQFFFKPRDGNIYLNAGDIHMKRVMLTGNSPGGNEQD